MFGASEAGLLGLIIRWLQVRVLPGPPSPEGYICVPHSNIAIPLKPLSGKGLRHLSNSPAAPYNIASDGVMRVRLEVPDGPLVTGV